MCFSVVCVHYVDRSDDQKNGVPPRDTDSDGRPDFVEHVLRSVTHVHQTYVDAGYRPPARDGRRGGDARPDIYLAQIGNKGLYGYCTTDQARVPDHGSAWAYCVLDNDYARTEFPHEHADREHAGDGGARVLPRRAVRLRHRRGPVVHGGHRHLGRGRGLRPGQRQRQLPAVTARSGTPACPLDTRRAATSTAPGSSSGT